MAGFLKDLPSGFGKTVELLNQLQESLLCEMCHGVVSSMKLREGTTEFKTLTEGYKNEGTDLTPTEVNRIVNTLIYLYRKAVELKISTSNFKTELRENLHLTDSAVSALSQVWEEQGPSLISMDISSHMFGVGQLVDMQWKLGVGISSDTCKNLNTPYVTMQIKVADPSGRLSKHTFEMTVTQFQNFSKQMKEMSNILETV